jgi:hypothetical protein
MRYAVASCIAGVLTVALLAYSAWVKQWEATLIGQIVPARTVLAIKLGYFISNFWYAIAVVLFAVSLTIAALSPTEREDSIGGG